MYSGSKTYSQKPYQVPGLSQNTGIHGELSVGHGTTLLISHQMAQICSVLFATVSLVPPKICAWATGANSGQVWDQERELRVGSGTGDLRPGHMPTLEEGRDGL